MSLYEDDPEAQREYRRSEVMRAENHIRGRIFMIEKAGRPVPQDLADELDRVLAERKKLQAESVTIGGEALSVEEALQRF